MMSRISRSHVANVDGVPPKASARGTPFMSCIQHLPVQLHTFVAESAANLIKKYQTREQQERVGYG